MKAEFIDINTTHFRWQQNNMMISLQICQKKIQCSMANSFNTECTSHADTTYCIFHVPCKTCLDVLMCSDYLWVWIQSVQVMRIPHIVSSMFPVRHVLMFWCALTTYICMSFNTECTSHEDTTYCIFHVPCKTCLDVLMCSDYLWVLIQGVQVIRIPHIVSSMFNNPYCTCCVVWFPCRCILIYGCCRWNA